MHRILDVGEPKLPTQRKNNDYFQIQHSTRLDGIASTSARFDYVKASDYHRHLHLECIDTLVVSTKDCFDQKTLPLLLDVENFFIYCFILYSLKENLHLIYYSQPFKSFGR